MLSDNLYSVLLDLQAVLTASADIPVTRVSNGMVGVQI